MTAALAVAALLEVVDLSATVWAESRGVVAAVSAKGAVGLCGIVPKYSRWTAAELMNPWINLAACVEARAYWRHRAARAGKPWCGRQGYRAGNEGFRRCLRTQAGQREGRK